MGFEVTVSKELNLVYTKYSGFVKTRETEQAMFATVEHPDFLPGMSELTDLSEVEGTELVVESMDAHTSQLAVHYEMQAKLTTHYIYAPDDVGFGLAQAHREIAKGQIENLTVLIFRSEAEVLNAMGRNESSIAELLRAGFR
ncbi:hypothetical protein BXY66_1109 [Shimia isoporae]|uniref:Uncharacterized protein n=1 Tax=Shimia isoporae TaxID=647720 RepID=A0A4R1NL49_9RHOB|nr:hypothetical protein [Shimia isoporae]TCL09066.1 hypothetical protein BXY66_1109 [Shimia isoporae]